MKKNYRLGSEVSKKSANREKSLESCALYIASIQTQGKEDSKE